MATFLAFLALSLLTGACYFIYTRSLASAKTDEDDLQRFMLANRELHLERIDHALWDTAMKISHGDEGVARARYIELRVRQMKNETLTETAG